MSESLNDAKKIPSEAMIQLMAPDGYYTYFGISKSKISSDANASSVDEDLIKKQYRRLSLKHHPDKRGGDAETFRVLNRAQKVLLHPKLRQQYDNLGLDLDDDEAVVTDEDHPAGGGDQDEQTTTQGIVHEIASMALTNVLQLGVRTLMMGTVSVFIVRYRLTVIPAILFLMFIAYRIHSAASKGVVGTSSYDVLSPCLIGLGLILMHQASYSSLQLSDWGYWSMFWVGESLVIGMFTYNSFSLSVSASVNPTIVYVGISIVSLIAALIVRGKFWNYAIVIGLELFLAIFIAISFPVMEMVLEAILNDKLKKVGEKVRAHHAQLKKYYEAKQQEQ